ncbi:5550_t:CDS:2, partial [Funneliformis caledonium]
KKRRYNRNSTLVAISEEIDNLCDNQNALPDESAIIQSTEYTDELPRVNMFNYVPAESAFNVEQEDFNISSDLNS